MPTRNVNLTRELDRFVLQKTSPAESPRATYLRVSAESSSFARPHASKSGADAPSAPDPWSG